MEDIRIIGDSSTDLADEARAELGVGEIIPFYLNIAGEIITDDKTLNVSVLLQKMKACTVKMTTACGSPHDWKEAFVKAGKGFAVTLSQKLSGSYAAACAGLKMAKEESGCEGHVFDSMSAVSGETLLVYKIREFIDKGFSMDEIIEKTESFIKSMKTIFVLDDVSNLVKNGRMSRIKGTLVNVLGIKPLLHGKDGEIELLGKVRGEKKIAEKMVDMIASSGREINGDDLVVSHCNNLLLAQEVIAKAKVRFNFGKIRIVEMKGLSTFYACDKGIVMSF